jgi:hypothetical protein
MQYMKIYIYFNTYIYIYMYIYIYVLKIFNFLVNTYYRLFFYYVIAFVSGKGNSNHHFYMKTQVLLYAFSYLPILWRFALFLSSSNWYLVFHAENIVVHQFSVIFSVEFCLWEFWWSLAGIRFYLSMKCELIVCFLTIMGLETVTGF